jgi:hypothetical protein
MATNLPSLVLYTNVDFMDVVRREAASLDCKMSELIRDAAERALNSETPLPVMMLKVRRPAREVTEADLEKFRLHLPEDLKLGIEAAAKREGVRVRQWIEAALIDHVLKTYSKRAADHEAIARSYRADRARLLQESGLIPNGWEWVRAMNEKITTELGAQDE